MGYELIPLVVSILLMVRHVAFEEAALGSKVMVGAVVIASLAIGHYSPRWFPLAISLQSAISIYLLIYSKRHATTAG